MIGVTVASQRQYRASRAEPAAASDRELLVRFLNGEERAFADLVQRHAGLVTRVCRRILRHETDAEDAFQATFLVLARKARSLVGQESVAGWLHQTARRTSLKLRTSGSRRREREAAAAQPEGTHIAPQDDAPETSAAARELAGILDDELAALPARFREVIVLSQVEGLGRDELAARLGVSEAAVKDRLERGRERLRARLARRGITLSATALAAWLAPSTAQAAITSLATATAQAAAGFAGGSSTLIAPSVLTLAQGVLKMMGLEKLKLTAVYAAAILAAGTVALGMLQDDPQRFEKGIRGEIVAFQAAGKTPTVTVRLDEHGALLNLDVAKDAKVWTAYEPSALASLAAGQTVSLRLADDHRTVNEIHVGGRRREVEIKAIAESGAITAVDADDDEDDGSTPKSEQFQLAPDAILRIGGLPASRKDLQPGMRVPLEFSGRGAVVNAIEAEADPALVADGEIVEIDGKNSQIKMSVEIDDAPSERVYAVVSETLIHLDGKPAALDALKPRFPVTFRKTADQVTLLAIRATTPPKDEDDDDAAPAAQ